VKCPRPEILLAAAENRLAPDAAAAWQTHIAQCPECTRNLAALRDVGAMLAELGRAAAREPAGPVWAHVAARLDGPGIMDRLPLGVAGLLRLTHAFLQPAVAGGVVATVGGLVLGTWLAIAFDGAPANSLAMEPYATSSLADDSGSGLSDGFFAIGDASASQDVPSLPGAGEAALPETGGADSGGVTP